MKAAKAAAGPRKKVSHTVSTRDDKTITFDGYTKGFAIRCMCSHCLGWSEDPADCTSPLCPLYPFRGRTLKTLKGDK